MNWKNARFDNLVNVSLNVLQPPEADWSPAPAPTLADEMERKQFKFLTMMELPLDKAPAVGCTGPTRLTPPPTHSHAQALWRIWRTPRKGCCSGRDFTRQVLAGECEAAKRVRQASAATTHEFSFLYTLEVRALSAHPTPPHSSQLAAASIALFGPPCAYCLLLPSTCPSLPLQDEELQLINNLILNQISSRFANALSHAADLHRWPMRRYWFGLTCEVGPMIKQRKVRVMVASQLV